MIPWSPPLVSEDLAVQMRATKQVHHIRDMQGWDYEWIRLTYSEKNSRELSEIANAYFARGRSIGVNYEDLSVPRLRGPKPHQSSAKNARH